MTDDGHGAARAHRSGASGQQHLIERATEVLGRNARVLGVWLAGSFARGAADEFSDVDLRVVVVRCGSVWPQQLEDSVRRHLATSLSITVPR